MPSKKMMQDNWDLCWFVGSLMPRVRDAHFLFQ